MTSDEILKTIRELRAMGATSIEVQGVKCIFPATLPTQRSVEQKQHDTRQEEDEDLYAAT